MVVKRLNIFFNLLCVPLFLQCLQGVHPLFLCEQALYAIVFDIHDPFKLESVVSWMLLMRSKVRTLITVCTTSCVTNF